MTLDPSFLLFVPADRPDRYAKALAVADATGAILDLEDAVAPERKDDARRAVAAFLDGAADRSRIVVRVNPPRTPAGVADIAALAAAAAPAAVAVPKVEGVDDVAAVAGTLAAVAQIVLIESARGLVHAEAIASAEPVVALGFGPYDLSAELGAQAEADVLLPHRARLVVAARAAGKAVIDGPSREYGDVAIVERDARHARRLGFDGKLLIHPAQAASVRAAFAPSDAEIAYARRVVAASREGSPAVLDGTMIDAPIIALAERVLRRAGITPTH